MAFSLVSLSSFGQSARCFNSLRHLGISIASRGPHLRKAKKEESRYPSFACGEKNGAACAYNEPSAEIAGLIGE
jgi:hypothetical protein